MTEKISLLWPEDYDKSEQDIIIKNDSNLFDDLDLKPVLKQMSISRKYQFDINSVTDKFTDQKNVIEYRLELIEDLLENPDICDCFREILPVINELENMKSGGYAEDSELKKLVNRIVELELYVDSIDKLFNSLEKNKSNINSRALKNLHEKISEIAGQESFKNLKNELPELKSHFKGLKSVTIGINLDPQLRPAEAVLVSVNDQKYSAGNIIDRLINLDFKNDKFRGISELQNVVTDRESAGRNRSLIKALNRNLEKVMKSTIRPVAPKVSNYSKKNARFLLKLKSDMLFLLGAVRLIKKFQKAGLPLCKPKVLKMDKRQGTIKGLYNINLALQTINESENKNIADQIVKNEASFDDQGRIFILTGPNRGGKTTYAQAVGQIQFMFQLGLFVPAKSASLSPVDNIYTHFPVEEGPKNKLGRLGEECKRLKQIFNQATSRSLVLLNESLSSTSPGEGLYIARELLIGFKMMGVRVVYATHFHELATNLEIINQEIAGDSKVVSLVAGLKEKEEGKSERTYKIEEKEPQGLSYARDIASQFGVSIDKIHEKLRERGVLEQDINFEKIKDLDIYK